MATRAEALQGERAGHGFGINPEGFRLGQDFWRRARVALLPPGFLIPPFFKTFFLGPRRLIFRLAE